MLDFTTADILTAVGLIGTIIASHIRQEITQDRRASTNHAELVAQMTEASEKNFSAHADRKQELTDTRETLRSEANEQSEKHATELTNVRERVVKLEAKAEAG